MHPKEANVYTVLLLEGKHGASPVRKVVQHLSSVTIPGGEERRMVKLYLLLLLLLTSLILLNNSEFGVLGIIMGATVLFFVPQFFFFQHFLNPSLNLFYIPIK